MHKPKKNTPNPNQKVPNDAVGLLLSRGGEGMRLFIRETGVHSLDLQRAADRARAFQVRVGWGGMDKVWCVCGCFGGFIMCSIVCNRGFMMMMMMIIHTQMYTHIHIYLDRGGQGAPAGGGGGATQDPGYHQAGKLHTPCVSFHSFRCVCVCVHHPSSFFYS